MARLWAVGQSRVQILVGTRDVSLLCNIWRGSGPNQPFLRVKLLVCEVDYSHLVLSLAMNGGILLLPHMLSCHGQEELCFMFMTDFMKFAIIQ